MPWATSAALSPLYVLEHKWKHVCPLQEEEEAEAQEVRFLPSEFWAFKKGFFSSWGPKGPACVPPLCPAQSDDALTHSPPPFIFLSFSNLSKGEEEDVEEEEQVVVGMSADQETDRHFCHHHILLWGPNLFIYYLPGRRGGLVKSRWHRWCWVQVSGFCLQCHLSPQEDSKTTLLRAAALVFGADVIGWSEVIKLHSELFKASLPSDNS